MADKEELLRLFFAEHLEHWLTMQELTVELIAERLIEGQMPAEAEVPWRVWTSNTSVAELHTWRRQVVQRLQGPRLADSWPLQRLVIVVQELVRRNALADHRVNY